MTEAICITCGAEKTVAFATCDSCKSFPKSSNELVLSLALSKHLCSESQLDAFSSVIRNDLKLSVPEALLNQAREALTDPQLMAMLDNRPQPKNKQIHVPPVSKSKEVRQWNESNSSHRRKRSLRQSQLQKNPFALLGVTIRDDRHRIVSQAEEKSLELDHDACQKARSDLTSPRMRLSAEMSWLPGVSPRKAARFVSTLHSDPMSLREESGLPTLAHLNLLAAAFEAVDGNDSVNDTADFIKEIVYLANDLSAKQVLRDINEDRAASGFPEVKGIDQVEAELSERKRYYRNAIKDVLNRLPTASLVDAMTTVVDQTTCGGGDHAPELIDDLVDSYAVEAQGFLQKEAESVEKLIQAARDSAKSGENVVKPIVEKLIMVARNWDNVAQPIQLSAKARGIDHEPSREIAYSIRSLAIDLCNEHGMLSQSQRLTELSQDIFAELPEVVEQVDEDAEVLADIFRNREQAEAQKAEWARDITYRAVMSAGVLSISPSGAKWKNQRFPLNTISRVRWGAVRDRDLRVTIYALAFGDNRSEAVVELMEESTYSTFLEKLWKAVVIRLLAELFETLKSGNEIRFGEATLSDDGVTLVKHRTFGANEKARRSWRQVRVWSADGSFYIGAKDDKKTYVGLSYLHVSNTHVLEQAIQMAFKKPGMHRLSDILR